MTTTDGYIQLPRLGSYLRETHYVIRHHCWIDRIPWFAKQHLMKMIKEAFPDERD